MSAVVEKVLCPSQIWICFIGTPLLSRRLAQVCPYGIIRTNRKTLVLQWVDWSVLILFPLKTVLKRDLREGVKTMAALKGQIFSESERGIAVNTKQKMSIFGG